MNQYSTSSTPCSPADARGPSRSNSQRRSPARLQYIAVLLVAAGVACTTPPPPSTATSGESTLARAQQESRAGNHAAAARAYEQLADRSRGRLRDGLVLRAADEWVQAGDTNRASTLLNTVGATLSGEDTALRAQVAAAIALATAQPRAALTELDRVPASAARTDRVLGLRARALFAVNEPAAAVTTALDRENLLANRDAVHGNHQLIWEGLQQVGAAAASQAATQTDARVRGWLELAPAATSAERNPLTARAALEAWRGRYPTHPANQFITEEVLPALGENLNYPPAVALLLPLSGRQQAAGIAVRDGFLASLLRQDALSRPIVNVYDTAALGAVGAYERALREGAQFVVGPLIKEEVAELANSNAISVPTLALNYLPDASLPPGLLYQFALDPEDEARQVARRIIADGRTHGVALLPENDWGRRLLRAFEAEFAVAGGTLVGTTFYSTAARDYSQPITRLLLIDQSRARANALAGALGTRFEFEPRARGDVQFVFVGAQPVQGRSLRPALRFHLTQDLPVYATSDVYETESTENADLDGIVFPDMPWIIAPDATGTELRSVLANYWPARSRGRGRLYAFGYDAFQLIPLLRSPSTAGAVAGLTGRLVLDANGRVRRELDWAQVVNGRPRPIASLTTGL